MRSIVQQADIKKAKHILGQNTDSSLLVEYCIHYKLSLESIQELTNYYSDQNQDNPNFYSEAQTQFSENGISI